MKYSDLRICILFGTAVMSAAITGCSSPCRTVDVDADLKFCHTHVRLALTDLVSGDSSDYSMIPRNIAPGDSLWTLRPATAEEWCSGFWPGVLWLDYESSRDEEVGFQARRYTEALEHILDKPVFDHDLGFLMFCSYGNAYRITREPHYRDVILRTADSLATLFNPSVAVWRSQYHHG